MKNKLIVTLLILTGTSAMAQTQVNPQTQINQTRDFVSSLLNQMSASNQPGRFAGSSDYAEAGLQFQKDVEAQLARFRDSMTVLASGALGRSVEQYNSLVRETSISESEKKSRLELQFKSLEIQARAATATYQAALASLYSVEKSFYLAESEDLTHFNLDWMKQIPVGKIYHFADGTQLKMKNYIKDNRNEKNTYEYATQLQIQKKLNKKCASKLCQSSMLADYSYFYSSVISQVDRDLVVSLADGKYLTLAGLAGRFQYIITAISTYSFDTNEFRALPDSK